MARIILGCLLTLSLCGQVRTAPPPASTLDDAVTAYDRGDSKQAESILQDLVRKGKFSAPVYYYLGLIFHDRDDLVTAERYYRSAIRLDKNYAPAYSDLAAIAISTRTAAEGESLARQAIALDPKFSKGHANLAAALSSEHRDAEAYQEYLTAATLNPDDVYDLGNRMMLDENDPKAAAYFYGIVLKAHPDHLPTIANYAAIPEMNGDFEAARKLLEPAYLANSPDKPAFDFLYAKYFRLLLDMGEFDKILRIGMEKAPLQSAAPAYFRALALYKLGRRDEFRKAAAGYFAQEHQAMPQSLEAWADQEIRPPAKKP